MSHKMNDHDEGLSEVNVIPLADLSLVLLIILMVLSPMAAQTLFHIASAQANKAQSQQDLATPEVPVIVTYEPTALKLNGIVMVDEMDFVKKLESVMAPRVDKSVLITASPAVMHGKVVHIMDLVKRHGAASLVMVKWNEGTPS